MHIDTIIVATDLSETSESAARWAFNARRLFGAKVKVAHVIKIGVKNWFHGAYKAGEVPDLKSSGEAKLLEWYERVTGEAADEAEIHVGSVLHQLTDIVHETPGRSVLVVSTTGHSKVGEFFLGSSARNIASTPPCPMVVVHPDHEAMHKGAAVVVGTDFSPNADKAVNMAAAFARALDSDLFIVHANPIPPVMVLDGGEVPLELLEKSAQEWSEREMEAFLDGNEMLKDVNVETIVVRDPPSDALKDVVKRVNADLLVVGHSGETELMQHVMGSVAQSCLNRISCTTIIIPHA